MSRRCRRSIIRSSESLRPTEESTSSTLRLVAFSRSRCAAMSVRIAAPCAKASSRARLLLAMLPWMAASSPPSGCISEMLSAPSAVLLKSSSLSAASRDLRASLPAKRSRAIRRLSLSSVTCSTLRFHMFFFDSPSLTVCRNGWGWPWHGFVSHLQHKNLGDSKDSRLHRAPMSTQLQTGHWVTKSDLHAPRAVHLLGNPREIVQFLAHIGAHFLGSVACCFCSLKSLQPGSQRKYETLCLRMQAR
mmetsp:Transcript_3317/g.7812  ORF Transcript_3317/g.7812 Transcript_3317/m.7812 type:complete len:246 (-) Transcript_3317:349-1086(-)